MINKWYIPQEISELTLTYKTIGLLKLLKYKKFCDDYLGKWAEMEKLVTSAISFSQLLPI